MTITHKATPAPEAPAKPAKARKPKKEAPTTTIEPAPDQPATETDASAKPEKRAKPKKAPKGPTPLMTLAELAEHYLAHLTATKSAGTALSYKMELDRAVDFLGADTAISTLTREDIQRFESSDLVMKKRNGQPKAAPSYLKTQRVIRLALTWAANDRKWIEWLPYEAK